MPLYIKDDITAKLVAQFAKLRGISKQDAVRIAVQAKLDRATRGDPAARPLRRLAPGT